MIKKMRLLELIMDTGIIAVIRAESAGQALKTVDAVLKGGINVIEVTMTVPGALGAMEELTKNYAGSDILPGAGTVLDAETARAALLAGAEFIVGPGLNPEVVRLCNRYQILNMAGCMTVNEVIAALEAGADIIKLFPGNLFGPAAIKAFKGPLPQAEFIPTGGVTTDNAAEWLNNGCLAVGVGGELTRGAAEGDYDRVTKTAHDFVEKIRAAR